MHVLMIDDRSPAAAAAAESLRASGRTLRTCEIDERGRCAALRGDACPLDADPVDVAVLVRAEGGPPRPEEAGVLCAARRRVPVVIAGTVADHPYDAVAAAEDEGVDLAATVATVHALPLAEHTVAANVALGHSPSVRASVYRRNGRLVARLRFDGEVPAPSDVGRAAVRVAGAVRAVDPWAAGIDVVAG